MALVSISYSGGRGERVLSSRPASTSPKSVRAAAAEAAEAAAAAAAAPPQNKESLRRERSWEEATPVP